jgi:hypothetical protein
MPTTAIGSTGITYPNGATNGGFINSATAIASTSGTSIDFTSIPSWVERITLVFQGVSISGSSWPFLVQIGPSGGVETSGYNGASSTLTSNATSSTNYTDGFAIRNDNSSAATIHGIMTIVNITGNSWAASGVFGQSDRAITLPLGYSKTLAGTLSRLRITTNGGTDTFDAGTINILYE